MGGAPRRTRAASARAQRHRYARAGAGGRRRRAPRGRPYAGPAFDAGGFRAAGAVRATPRDLLTFLEAHLAPPPEPLAGALLSMHTPVLRRGLDRRHVHTVGWFRHPTDGGSMYFHSGAPPGQQAFLGFRPDTGTAVAALCTRRFRAHGPFVAAAYALLAEQ
ncbi:serine hydrolase [Streptomyces sp. NPDC087903]|uniref:serine hydrolase n=1 Tax=Streptomyces sp. NPDC087903 TaxID=3365819 RepID=UPI00382ED83E